jgi:hypothetical protein
VANDQKLNDQIRKLIADGIATFPPELVEQLRSLGKKEFFRVYEASMRHTSQK